MFVVWSGQVGNEGHVPAAAELIPDPRVRHYWDQERVAGKAFRNLDDGAERLELDFPAWDVWLIFDADARWTDGGPPRPIWWEHQLGDLLPSRRLDAERFARKAVEATGRAER